MSRDQNQYWTAFYTKPRSEKKAATRLQSRGFEIYCPVRTVLKQWSDRKKKIKEPVFTSYLFARVDETARQQILMDASIVASVFWLKAPVVIRDQEIEAIRAFLDEYPEAEGAALEINPGDHATIKAGPLSGETGVVIQTRKNKAVLQIKNLGLELKAEVAVNKLDLVS